MTSFVLPVDGDSKEYEVAPSKIIALGLNYREHIAESLSVRVRGFTAEEPPEPILFPKLPNALLAPGKPIVLPAIAHEYGFTDVRTDYEAELAVIIGKTARNVSASQALEYVYGYTAANDVSQRNIQNADRSGWARGKSFDTFLPLGPVVVPAESVPDPQALDLRCELNGRLVQHSSTGLMIFPVNETISFISRNFTLYPGDIILTGTPAGVGPLSAGDTVTVTIDRIGALSNPVATESAT